MSIVYLGGKHQHTAKAIRRGRFFCIMATRRPNKEKKKPKKKVLSNPNGKLTTQRAMYDNNLVGISNYGLNRGY